MGPALRRVGPSHVGVADLGVLEVPAVLGLGHRASPSLRCRVLNDRRRVQGYSGPIGRTRCPLAACRLGPQGRWAGRSTCSPAGRRWTDRYASGPSTAATALTVPWAGERRPSGPADGPGRQGSAHPGRGRPPPAPRPRRCGGARCDRPGPAGPGWPAGPPRPATTAPLGGSCPRRGWPDRPEGWRQACPPSPIPDHRVQSAKGPRTACLVLGRGSQAFRHGPQA